MTEANDTLPPPSGESRLAAVDCAIDAAIGERLRAAFQPIVSEQIPQHFIDLLDQLVAADSKLRAGS